MDDLSPDTRALLDRARHGEFLPAARRRTMRGRLAVALGVAAPLTLASALTASAGVTSWMTRGLVVFGVAGAVAVSAAPFLFSPPERAPQVETARAVGARGERLQRRATAPLIAPEPVAPEPARERQVERTVTLPRRAPPAWGAPAFPRTPLGAPASPMALDVAPVASPSPSPSPLPAPLPETPAGSPSALAEDALAFEARLLTDARRSAARGDAPSALSLLDEHDRRFTAGALSPESHAIRVDALCAAGRTAQARAEARAFRAQYPTSPLVRRFASTCAAADGGGLSAAPSR